MDIETLYLYQRIEALEWAMNWMLKGTTHMAADDPFVIAKTDLTEWHVGVVTGRSTHLQGWLLYQNALWECEVERLLYAGDVDTRRVA